MKTGDFYKLTNNSGGFVKGTIVLLGDTETMEFFDITTEISTSLSYSSYNVNKKYLKRLDNNKQTELRLIFDDFINNNYKTNKEILNF